MDIRIVLADTQGPGGKPSRTRVSEPELVVLIAPRAALAVILLLSVGLWALIWIAATGSW